LELEQAIDRIQRDWSRAPLVKALQAFRGIRLVTAATVAAEIGDFRRFSKAPAFMSFLGLTPSERSTGENGSRGHITKTGNRHVRRVLVEAAHSYRFRPRVSRALQQRQEGVSQDICAISLSAQKRLHGRYYRLLNRGKNKQQTVTAVARELAGFIWDAAQQVQQDAAC
jgi:transposase